MARVLVFGAYGMLGSVLCPVLDRLDHTVFRQGRAMVSEYRADPGSLAQVADLVENIQPQIVVNLVALTNVDLCETYPQLAYQANVRPVEVLANVLCHTSCHLVHISTDQVYDGRGPHTEDRVAPCNVYALSKYTGELLASTLDATILRTNFVGRSYLHGRVAFTDWLVESFRERRSITLFDDILFSALHTSALCSVIELAVKLKMPGTYNVGCTDGISKATFALELAQRLSLDATHVVLKKAANADLKARRPLDMTLAVQHFEKAFGIIAPTMNQTLECVAQDYKRDIQDE